MQVISPPALAAALVQAEIKVGSPVVAFLVYTFFLFLAEWAIRSKPVLRWYEAFAYKRRRWFQIFSKNPNQDGERNEITPEIRVETVPLPRLPSPTFNRFVRAQK